jgi:iron complex outermembrane receptor protein
MNRVIIGALLLASWTAPVNLQAQTGTIRGRVTIDTSSVPLTGVTISFGGRSVQTQADGRYLLTQVPAGTDTLRARLIGYMPIARSVTVGSGQTADADFRMTASAVSLSEIVVTGYGEQRAGNITGAVTQVSSADFNTGRVISPEELIRSKVPGVQVVDNNEPGGGFSVRIRGATSINASSEPLFVIDGVPVGTGAGGGLSAGRNPLNFLNPNEIEDGLRVGRGSVGIACAVDHQKLHGRDFDNRELFRGWLIEVLKLLLEICL